MLKSCPNPSQNPPNLTDEQSPGHEVVHLLQGPQVRDRRLRAAGRKGQLPRLRGADWRRQHELRVSRREERSTGMLSAVRNCAKRLCELVPVGRWKDSRFLMKINRHFMYRIRVTHQVVANLPLTSKQKFRFGQARTGQAKTELMF